MIIKEDRKLHVGNDEAFEENRSKFSVCEKFYK